MAQGQPLFWEGHCYVPCRRAYLFFYSFFNGTNILHICTLLLSPLLNAILDVNISEIEFIASPMAPNMGL